MLWGGKTAYAAGGNSALQCLMHCTVRGGPVLPTKIGRVG